jgi:hypothetical protein
MLRFPRRLRTPGAYRSGSAEWDQADLGGLIAQSWNGNELVCLTSSTRGNAHPGMSLNTLTFVACGFVYGRVVGGSAQRTSGFE